MKSNAEELPDMVGLCSRYHLERLDVSYLNVAEGMDFGESLFNHPELAEKVFSKARRRAGELGVELRLPPLVGKDSAKRRCLHPWQFCQIDTDGSIRFCYKAWRQRIGFFHEGFRSVWQGDRYAKLRRTLLSDAPFFPYCRHCSVLRGFNHESSHNQTLHRDAYTIPELMDLQVPFNRRPEESLRAFRGSTPD
jgi:MoaA/NifB/PqqE/SkfB family radical SAM enzyme